MSHVERTTPPSARELVSYREYVKIAQTPVSFDFPGSSAQQDFNVLSQLWMDEVIRKPIGNLYFRMQNAKVQDQPVLRIYVGAKTPAARNGIRALNRSFKVGLNLWIQEGRPKFSNIDAFKRQYLSIPYV